MTGIDWSDCRGKKKYVEDEDEENEVRADAQRSPITDSERLHVIKTVELFVCQWHRARAHRRRFVLIFVIRSSVLFRQ